ncbi:SAM-dependent methyltransferase [Nocardiopsis exhalans]|uniref:SAM-dependent methyltransferase n=1 Tax=Nocardiopsis exhalans TaxID=163604 RepID=A0ABY5D3D8_9ACTN|nr:N-6 DNA methylase [Nocardiopsis exhalans]USY17935.1 SAM-dependent methyltransferase [Nocardiopsis exhalans]
MTPTSHSPRTTRLLTSSRVVRVFDPEQDAHPMTRTTAAAHRREIAGLLRANAGPRRLPVVFDNFVETAALTLRNAVETRGRGEREAQYLAIADRYSRQELDRFARALALTTLAMEAEPGDVLGRLYMELELGNDRLGQVYTPDDIARLMAAMTIGNVVDQVATHGFAQLYEPTCGAGAFIVAVTEEMGAHGLNHQTQLHVTAEDLSRQAVHMIYIHLALLGVPAIIRHQDTLTREVFSTWPTPAHLLGGWGPRLQRRSNLNTSADTGSTLPTEEEK